MELVATPSPTPNRPESESDWNSFLDTFGRTVIHWFRQYDLSASEAMNLAREVLRVLQREFVQRAPASDTRFRQWLPTAVEHAWRHVRGQHESAAESARSAVATVLKSAEIHDAFLQAMDLECLHQRRRLAMSRVQDLADPAEWEAFWLNVVQQVPVAEVALLLQGPELAVHAAVFRIRRLLGEELQRIDDHC